MIIKKKEIEKALLNIINTGLKLEAIEKFAKEHGIPPEEVKPYNEALKILSNYQNEFDQIFEGAKENLIEDFDDKAIDLLDKIERFNPNEIQEYYLTETYVNLANIVNRAKQIKPLFIKRQGPLYLGNKYREAVLCYLNGRFDACCIMSRTIIESILRDLNGRKTEKCSLSELIKISAKSRILSEKTLKLATDIRKRGNISAHKRKLAGEQDAIESIKDTQSFIKSIF